MSLAEHRIARVDRLELQQRYPRRIGRNARLRDHGTGPAFPAVVLTTDQGARGWGVGRPDDALTKALVGQSVDALIDPARGASAAVFEADFALWDLAGVILGQPVWRLLGARGPRAPRVYSGAIYFDDLDLDAADRPRGLAGVLASCAEDQAAGYSAFKLKIGRGHRWMDRDEGDRRDILVTRAVREAYPRAELLVDANDGYQPKGFATYLKAVADCRLAWIEEPFAEDADALRALRDLMAKLGRDALLADGEGGAARAEQPGRLGRYEPAFIEHLLGLAAKQLIDVVLFDVTHLGFSPWVDLLPRLIERGIQAGPHTWGLTIKSCYAAHLAAGLGGVAWVEGVPGQTDGVDSPAWAIAGGTITPPDAPGFGLGLDGALVG